MYRMSHVGVYFGTWKIIGAMHRILTIHCNHLLQLPRKQRTTNPRLLTHFSSALEGIPHKLVLTKTDCEEIMRSKLGERSFTVENFRLRYFVELMGFHGNHGGLAINCLVDGKSIEYRFFVKTIANNPIIKEKYWDVHRQPYKEFVFLTKIHKELQKFVHKCITADCHWGRLEEVLVMDDCCSMGYSAMNRQYLDTNHALAGVCALANLHAASIIYNEKTGDSILEKYKDVDYESLFGEHPERPKAFLLHSLDAGVRQIGSTYFTDIIPAKSLDTFFSTIRLRTCELLQNHPHEFHQVFCQGDPAKSNLLFKYNDIGVATDAILVDFGVLRFAPPAMELMQFLHLNSTNMFRATHDMRLRNEYYDRLSEICGQNSVDVSSVLSRDQFQESCAYYNEWAICVRVYYEYVLRLPADQLLKVANSVKTFLNLMTFGSAELGLESFSKDEAYKKSTCILTPWKVHCVITVTSNDVMTFRLTVILKKKNFKEL